MYKGTQVIPVLAGGKPLIGKDSLYASATIDKNAGKVYIKLVNSSRSVRYPRINLEGPAFSSDGVLVTLKSQGLYDYNSMSDPQHIFPTGRQIEIEGKKINVNLDAISVNVLIISYKK